MPCTSAGCSVRVSDTSWVKVFPLLIGDLFIQAAIFAFEVLLKNTQNQKYVMLLNVSLHAHHLLTFFTAELLLFNNSIHLHPNRSLILSRAPETYYSSLSRAFLGRD